MQILEKCNDIKWHFIGHLQSNKAAKFATLPNLFIIETVHSQKIATALNEALAKHNSTIVNVYVQVNTSAEDGLSIKRKKIICSNWVILIFISVIWYSAEKSGVLPEDTVPLSKFVIEECHHLKFCGLMTIGKYGYDTSLGLNPDFLVR